MTELPRAHRDRLYTGYRKRATYSRVPCASAQRIRCENSWLSAPRQDSGPADGNEPAPEDRELLFYQTLDTAPAPVLSPEQALDSFFIAPGLLLELVAEEPLIGDPVAMAWDEYGRLYVVEMRGFMPDAQGAGRFEPVGRVVRLEDTDADGRMDTSEVFLEQLVNPQAVAVTNAGVLIAEPPNLWLCELSGRDAACSEKRRLGDYAVAADGGNVEHLENKLLQGLDNWYYNSKSSRKLRLVDAAILIMVADRMLRKLSLPFSGANKA